MSNNIVSRLKRKKIQEVIATGKRMDGRELLEFRELEIKTNFLAKAEGSAEVRLGKSHVIVGVKAGVGHPFDDTPDKGVMMVSSEFTPVAHPTWEPGPPNEASIELARVVDRGIRAAEVIDMSKMCLISGEKVYLIFVDLYVLNYDGNLIDACSAGAMAALNTAEIPVYKVTKGKVELTDKTKKLKLGAQPIAITVVKIGNDLIVDPSADEEEVLDGRITITVDEKGTINAIQKRGAVGFTVDEIKKCINIAKEKTAEIRAIALASK
ncbi:MAG: exosome complex protein Rrp42 [Candidatus Bathyarchaeota archaeon]|nr:exosome complex protein Rrp42 [Candidatus Bathyarchaeota archaeon]